VSAPALALGVTLAVQALAALTLTTPSVLAPAMSRDLGVPAQHVGWLVSAAYLAAMLSGLNGGWLSERHGAVRTSQAAVLACCAGLLLLATGVPWVLLVAAVVIGVGYGLPNPTSADILSRHAPVHRRGLFFSIKQTGVPLGIALCGVVVAPLLALAGWRAALLVLAGPILLAAIVVGASRRALEAPVARLPGGARGGQGGLPDGGKGGGKGGGEPLIAALRARMLLPLREVFAHPPSRRLALASLVYALTQVAFLTFLVSLLNLEHRLSLAASAGLLSASQAASVVARVGWGYVSDRWVDPTRLLGVLGLLMAVGMLLLGLLPTGTPWPWMLAVTVLCAGTAVSWNGVFYADLVRHVPASQVARATGGTQFMTFMGAMAGSAVFAMLVGTLGGYGRVYAVLAVLPAVTGATLLASSARRTVRRPA
jgi:MFS family permease